MNQSEDIAALNEALAKAQGAIEGATKSGENPHFHSKYAGLDAVWDACRKPLSENGLAIHQGCRAVNGDLRLVTRVLHASGQWMADDGIPLLLDKQNMQGLGSAADLFTSLRVDGGGRDRARRRRWERCREREGED